MDLVNRYIATRARTEQLAAPLSLEDQVVQSMPDASPTKWHRAHTTWFFETFVLDGFDPYAVFDDDYRYLFNSYYEAVGPRHTRAHRGLITRPDNATVEKYRVHVDEAMIGLLRAGDADLDLVVLGLHHEEQHQELLLMDALDLLSRNPTRPTYRSATLSPSAPLTQGWVDGPSGIHRVGAEVGFHFDNEGPVHDVLLPPHQLADRPVTVGEWVAFIDGGGYDDARHWLSDGWAMVQTEGWDAPARWFRTDDGWAVHDLHGPGPLDTHAPVSHISYYEADAFARWAGARLPTEEEWEVSVRTTGAGYETAEGFRPVLRADGNSFHGLGQVWEWTSSAYLPYPGFVPAPGAVGEYNGKFMVNQHVLRGGSCFTPPGHARLTYRNFFPPATRWHCSGVRLAR